MGILTDYGWLPREFLCDECHLVHPRVELGGGREKSLPGQKFPVKVLVCSECIRNGAHVDYTPQYPLGPGWDNPGVALTAEPEEPDEPMPATSLVSSYGKYRSTGMSKSIARRVNDRDYFTTAEAASMVGCSTSYLYRLAASDAIPGLFGGNGKRLRWSLSQIDLAERIFKGQAKPGDEAEAERVRPAAPAPPPDKHLLSIDQRLWEGLNIVAVHRGIPVNIFVEQMLREGLKNNVEALRRLINEVGG